MIGAQRRGLGGRARGQGRRRGCPVPCASRTSPPGAVVAGVPARVIKMRDEKTDSKTGLEEGLRQL